jgi:saccharopine dehydrogenase-like NADP-dependent oxidoreductase
MSATDRLEVKITKLIQEQGESGLLCLTMKAARRIKKQCAEMDTDYCQVLKREDARWRWARIAKSMYIEN